MTSVITNGGALTALASLRSVNTAMDRTSKMVQTGYRVADAFDDASVFAVAQNVRAEVKSLVAVQASLNSGIGLGKVTVAALDTIYKTFGDLKAKVTSLVDPSLSSAQQSIYTNDIGKLIQQINNVAAAANFNGKNILTGAARAAPLSFIADTSGNTISYSTAHQIDWDSDIFLGPSVLFVTPTDLSQVIATNPINTAQAYAALDGFEGRVQEMYDEVVPTVRAMESQRDFIETLKDAMKMGLSASVDTDITSESATYISERASQQLVLTGLSIANQQHRTVLLALRA